MNISYTNKAIWWAPERTATNALSIALKNFDFEYQVDSKELKYYTDYENNHSHQEFGDNQFEDFILICSLRNPYDRVLSFFLKYEILPEIVFTKEIKPKLFDYFKEWINYCFEKNKLMVDFNDYGKHTQSTDAIKKFRFNNRIPDHFIRCENMIEDMNKIEFISQNTLWKTGDIQKFLTKNKYQYNPSYDFRDFYDYETAKIIYVYYFSHFHLGGYDPFSFSKSEINQNEKIRFLHDTF